jgi:hypothetical protein
MKTERAAAGPPFFIQQRYGELVYMESSTRHARLYAGHPRLGFDKA